MAKGFAAAATFLAARGRPASAFVACELRSPAAMSRSEFPSFNAVYADLLRQHGFVTGQEYRVARSNMAPQFAPPGAAGLFAFTFAVPCDGPGGRDFVISGKPENLDDGGIIAPGDTSPGGMAAKAAHALAQLRCWTEQLGASWSDITGAQAYTIRSFDGVIDVLKDAELGDVGLTLFPAFPPIDWCEFEIDVRAVSTELVV